MTKNSHILDDQMNAAIAASVLGIHPAPEVAARIKSKLMQRVETNAADHTFLFASQGKWKKMSEGVLIKILHKDPLSKSFLVRMAADTKIPSHLHQHDEESYVLEGEVLLEGILCRTGDFHMAKKGSRHQDIHTSKGCLLLVRSA